MMQIRPIIFFVLGLLFATSSFAKATPTVAAIASGDKLATEAGMQILKKGGNAFDAAVTVTAVLAVVEPFGSGIGGGGFYLLHQVKTNKNIFLDAREQAPINATATMYQNSKGQVMPKLSLNGPLAAAIPGEPAAIVELAEKYGNLPLQTTLAPAIKIAKRGFLVNKSYQRLVKIRLQDLKAYPAAAKQFLVNDNVPKIGARLKQPDLARTLESIARYGYKGFYSGKIAKQLVAGVQAAGGIWTLKDLQQYSLKIRKPLVGYYKGIKIITAPPPSAGGVAVLTMLNILAQFEFNDYAPVTRKHLVVEAMRRAYLDRDRYLGDPGFVNVPVGRLLSKTHIDNLSDSIQIDKATPSEKLAGHHKEMKLHTTHFSIIDKQGNRVAATLTINTLFGSGFVPPGTGVLLNNEMDDFSSKVGAPNVYGLVGSKANAIEPGKRPLSSMTPTFIETKDAVGLLGTPGGSRIPTMVLLAILDFNEGYGPRSWVAVPRFHHQYLPDQIQMEKDRFSQYTIQHLRKMGHRVKVLKRSYGDMQAVMWDKKKNIVQAAADPRGEGSGLVE